MTPRLLFTCWSVVWISALLLLFGFVADGSAWSASRMLWFGAAALLLAISAWDALLMILGSRRFARLAPADPVPTVLTDELRDTVIRDAARLAVLIPAGHEATTVLDRSSFLQRLTEDVLPFLPPQSTVFLLFDTHRKHRPGDRRVRAALMAHLARVGRPRPQVVAVTIQGKSPLLSTKNGSLALWALSFAPAASHGCEWRKLLPSLPSDPGFRINIRSLGGGTGDGACDGLINRFEYGLLLDADSSLRPAAPFLPQGRDVVLRLLAGMRQGGDRLAIIQCMLNILPGRTLFGLLEHVDGLLSERFFASFARVYGRNSPFFGHNAMFRIASYLRAMDLRYMSHDMIESARLAAAGQAVLFSPGAVISEMPEEPLCPHWIRRDIRWAIGSAQWIVLLLREHIPWQPRLYLGLTLVQYGSSLVGLCLLVCSIGLLLADPLAPAPGEILPRFCGAVLLIFSLCVNLAPRFHPAYFVATAASSIVRIVMAPAMLFLRCLSTGLACFARTVWIPRPCRYLPNLVGVGHAFLWLTPVALVGGFCWWLAEERMPDGGHWGANLLRFILWCLMASPFTAALLALPNTPSNWTRLSDALPDARPLSRSSDRPAQG